MYFLARLQGYLRWKFASSFGQQSDNSALNDRMWTSKLLFDAKEFTIIVQGMTSGKNIGIKVMDS